jgi:endoglucanase
MPTVLLENGIAKEEFMRSRKQFKVGIASGLFAFPLLAGTVYAVSGASGLYTPKPNHSGVEQVASLTSSKNKEDARLVKAMLNTPQAVWFSKGGTPESIKHDVHVVMSRAEEQGTLPVLVAYNIPFRDCAQFSAGGATTNAEYLSWIDGFATGIGNAQAMVILEPDGLGIVPWAGDWCNPAEANAETAAADRYSTLAAAVARLKQQPGTKVYLDGTHAGWMNPDAIAKRLIAAGVRNADGFFLNVSNYQFTANTAQYGTWISSCIAMADETGSNLNDGLCPNKWWNGGPVDDGWGQWNGVPLDNFGEWSDSAPIQNLNTANLNRRYVNNLAGRTPTTHFVIDTSRNGQGPWDPATYTAQTFADPQDWCNPPSRGLGLRPTLATGNALVDAFLWVKIPGESDGQCNRSVPGTTDPVRNMVDPAAGLWFPQQVLELVHLAVPPL